MLCFDFVAQSHTPPRRAAAAAAPQPPSRRPPQPRHQADCGYRAIRGRRKGAVRLGNGNESDSSAPTIRLATLIRGARTAAGGERAVIIGAGASTAASKPVEILGYPAKSKKASSLYLAKMAEKLPCTAVEKRKPLGTFWLECCGLARGAPRRPLGAAERFFFRDFALGNRKIFGSRCQKISKKPASELSVIPRKTRQAS